MDDELTKVIGQRDRLWGVLEDAGHALARTRCALLESGDVALASYVERGLGVAREAWTATMRGDGDAVEQRDRLGYALSTADQCLREADAEEAVQERIDEVLLWVLAEVGASASPDGSIRSWHDASYRLIATAKAGTRDMFTWGIPRRTGGSARNESGQPEDEGRVAVESESRA